MSSPYRRPMANKALVPTAGAGVLDCRGYSWPVTSFEFVAAPSVGTAGTFALMRLASRRWWVERDLGIAEERPMNIALHKVLESLCIFSPVPLIQR